MLKTISLLGVKVSRINPVIAVSQICAWAKHKERVYVCIAPVATLVDAKRDPAYARAVNEAAMVTPDGMPVVWLAKAKGCKDIMRTYGPDLMQEVCNYGQKMGLRHFFYGGTEETLERLQKKLLAAYPQMRIAGTYAPPFRPGIWQETPEIIERINHSRADVLWVGLGSPKQDFWMQNHRSWIELPVIIGAGAAFDFCAGVKPQAPRWMGACGLEWFFRLCTEPRRLWKRYLIGNSLFIMYVIKDLFKKPQLS